jgi:hypothetical protein
MMSQDDLCLKPAIKSVAAHRYGSAKQRHRPEQALLIDESEPQRCSFAMKAVVNSIGQYNNHVKTCGCGESLDETYIYNTRKTLGFDL